MAEGEQKKKKKKRGLPLPVFIILLAVLLGVAGYSAYRLIDYELQMSKADAVDRELLQYKPELPDIDDIADLPESSPAPGRPQTPQNTAAPGPNSGVRFIPVNDAILSLKARNPEFIGWVSIKDTNVDFAFAHTERKGYDGRVGEYYLYRDINEEHSISGSVFLDYRNDPEFNDPISLLYGHHMKKSAKFTYLDAFRSREYMEAHRELSVILEDRMIKGEIFAYCIVDASQTEFFSTEAIRDSALALDYAREHSVVYLPNDYSTEDRLIMLVTCDYNVSNGRAVLIAGVRQGTGN